MHQTSNGTRSATMAQRRRENPVDIELPLIPAVLPSVRADSVDVAIPLSLDVPAAAPVQNVGTPRLEDVAAHPSRLRARRLVRADGSRVDVPTWNPVRTAGMGLSEIAARGW